MRASRRGVSRPVLAAALFLAAALALRRACCGLAAGLALGRRLAAGLLARAAFLLRRAFLARRHGDGLSFLGLALRRGFSPRRRLFGWSRHRGRLAYRRDFVLSV